jgi:hypothetical protein
MINESINWKTFSLIKKTKILLLIKNYNSPILAGTPLLPVTASMRPTDARAYSPKMMCCTEASACAQLLPMSPWQRERERESRLPYPFIFQVLMLHRIMSIYTHDFLRPRLLTVSEQAPTPLRECIVTQFIFYYE